MKNPYIRIDFKNCGLDYDYTICEQQEIGEYIEIITNLTELLTDSVFNRLKGDNELPEIKLSIVMMTNQEFQKWFQDNVEESA